MAFAAKPAVTLLIPMKPVAVVNVKPNCALIAASAVTLVPIAFAPNVSRPAKPVTTTVVTTA